MEKILDFDVFPTQLTVAFGAKEKPYSLRFTLANQTSIDLVIASTKITNQSGLEVPAKISVIKKYAPKRYQIQVELRTSGNQWNGNLSKSNEFLTLTIEYSYNGKTYTVSSPAFEIVYASGSQVAAFSRSITVHNRCDFPVWVGAAPFYAKSMKEGQSCQNTQDCYPGSSCIQLGKKGLKQCVWNAPTPTDKQYRIEPSDKTVLSVPFFDNGLETFWEGAIAARTDCIGGMCQTGDCGSTIKGKSGGACKLGNGFSSPASIAHLALKGHSRIIYNTTPNGNAASDVYYISVAEGIHVPLAVTPAHHPHTNVGAPYECGVAGASNNNYPLGGCTWKFSPPRNDFQWVDYLGKAAKRCQSDHDCPAPYQCGLSFNPLGHKGEQLTKTCGNFLGYWTPHAICSKDPYFKSNFLDCRYQTQDLNTLTELFGCSKGRLQQSCYNKSADASCCGCVNWETVGGVKVPSSPLTKSCKESNSSWTLHAQPKLAWLKLGCPTASVYPHDEASSHFQCQTLDSHKVNTTHYTITFCP